MTIFPYRPEIDELFYAVRKDYFAFKEQLRIYKEKFPEKEFKYINLWKKSAEQYLLYFPGENIHDMLKKLADFKDFLKKQKEKTKCQNWHLQSKKSL